MQEEPRKQDEVTEQVDEHGLRMRSEDKDVEAHSLRPHHGPEKRYGPDQSPEKRY